VKAMKTSIIPVVAKQAVPSASLPIGLLDRLAKKMVIALLKNIETGRLTLLDNEARHEFGRRANTFSLHPVLTVHHSCFYRKAMWGGSIGVAEAYMAGDWDTDDVANVIRLMVMNRHIFEKLDRGWGRFMEPLHQYFHWINKNTRAGSRANITAHYDLGNNFYRLFWMIR